jgi:hypothetical protein
MLTFAEQAEKKESNNPTKYVMSKFENDGTRFYYQTTPSHPTENRNSDKRLLNLEIKSKISKKTIESFLSFLSTSQLKTFKSSYMEMFTPDKDNIVIHQMYIPEFNITDYSLSFTILKELKTSPKFNEFSSLVSKIMEDFYKIKIKLDYKNYFYYLKKTGIQNSEGVVGLHSVNSRENKIDNFTAHIFQSPLKFKTKDIVKTLFDSQSIFPNFSNHLEVITHSNGECLHVQRMGSFLEFRFDTGFVSPKIRKKYADQMLDIYKQITNTSPKSKFNLQEAFI